MTSAEAKGIVTKPQDVLAVEQAVRRSFGRAMLRHKLLRQPIWVDDGNGGARKVEPVDIVTGLTPEEEAEEIETSGHGTWFSE